jgi:hypothetical protein
MTSLQMITSFCVTSLQTMATRNFIGIMKITPVSLFTAQSGDCSRQPLQLHFGDFHESRW